MIRRGIGLCLTLSMGACASTYVIPPKERNPKPENKREYQQTFEKAWLKAVDWFAANQVVIDKIEKSSGLLTAKYLLTPRDERYLDYGEIHSPGSASSRTIHEYISLNLTVRADGDNRSRVTVNVSGRFELFWFGRLDFTGDCISTGLLEKEILDSIGE